MTLDQLSWLAQEKKILWMKDYIEFEDLVRKADFFFSNCGAGSISTSLAAGYAQSCRFAKDARQHDVTGLDTKPNADAIAKLNVGPWLFGPDEDSGTLFLEFMKHLQEHIDILQKRTHENAGKPRNCFQGSKRGSQIFSKI